MVKDILLEQMDEIMYEQKEMELKESSLVIPLDEIAYYNVLTEKATYSFLPKIKRDDDLQKLWKDAEVAERLLNDEGKDINKKDIYKLCDLALKIYTILLEIESGITAVACLTVVYIPLHLLQRAFVYALRLGEEQLGIMYAKKAKSELLKLKREAKDKTVKNKIDKQIKQIDESIEKLEQSKENK